MQTVGSAVNGTGKPLWLLAELTYRCPLQCLYCSNPVDFARYRDELSTADWLRVLQEGAPWALRSSACPAVSHCCVRTWKCWWPRHDVWGTTRT